MVKTTYWPAENVEMKYLLIEESSASDFNKKLNAMLDKGWSLHGSHFVCLAQVGHHEKKSFSIMMMKAKSD
ncbi:DUF1737 domain-containing protein [Ekhidna sp.]